MNTPIYDFVSKYINDDVARLHMPGHKGKGPLGFEKMDITEVFGADALYQASGIIKESEDNAALLFDSYKTFYSTEGSSHIIRAMLFLASRGKDDGYVLAARNAHSAFASACALIDLEVRWIECEDSYLSCALTPEKLEKALTCVDKIPFCVYVTSPDYLGNMLDIKGLSQVCHKHGTLLLVDNAHGAYLRFLESSLHPINLGADMCCDSAHKTLNALTGGAYLHISKNVKQFADGVKDALTLFASTSPSYLTLCSLDKLNAYLSGNYKNELLEFVGQVRKAKDKLCQLGYTLAGDEELKITIRAKEYGYLGTALADMLAKNNIYCEFCDKDFLVLMVTPQNTKEDLDLLVNVLSGVSRKEPIKECAPKVSLPERKMSIRQAIFSPSEEISIDEGLGRVLGCLSISCPPAVSVILAGEVLNASTIEACKYNGITAVKVVK